MRYKSLLLIFLINFNCYAALINDFDIRLTFNNDPQYSLTQSQQTTFLSVERFWEHLIIGYDNNIRGPGLDILASSPNIDGPGGILGQAGPRYIGFAPKNVYATRGIMNFDSADLLAMEANNSLFAIVFHEMAHVIGFGTLWDEQYNNLYDANNNYIGKYGLEAYQLEFDPQATSIPVEQEGGPGTAGGHWDEELGGAGGDRRIMTGWYNPGPYLSLTTVNSFRDLGYVINPNYILAKVPEPSTLALSLFVLFAFLRNKRDYAA